MKEKLYIVEELLPKYFLLKTISLDQFSRQLIKYKFKDHVNYLALPKIAREN